VLLCGELFDQLLVELTALRGQRDHPVAGIVSVGCVQRRRDDVHPQDHARAAAVRLVVDLAVPERRRVAVVEQAKLELGSEDGSERPLLREPGERVRDEREDIDSQSEGE
jgi:hypothetical protein